MHSLDLIEGSGSLPKFNKSWIFVNQLTIHSMPYPSHLIHPRPPCCRELLVYFRGGRSQEYSVDQLLQMTMSQRRIGISCCNHLTLFCETKTAIDTARRLGANPTIGWTSTTSDRSAPSVKDRQSNIMLLSNLCNILLPLI